MGMRIIMSERMRIAWFSLPKLPDYDLGRNVDKFSSRLTAELHNPYRIQPRKRKKGGLSPEINIIIKSLLSLVAPFAFAHLPAHAFAHTCTRSDPGKSAHQC
jgi:hypothetical protein